MIQRASTWWALRCADGAGDVTTICSWPEDAPPARLVLAVVDAVGRPRSAVELAGCELVVVGVDTYKPATDPRCGYGPEVPLSGAKTKALHKNGG